MRLRDLDARFLRIRTERISEYVDDLASAQGVMFQCPACAAGKPVEEEDGRRFVRGAHMVICWFADRGVPDDRKPTPGRWRPSGTGIDDLTFIGPGAASVQLQGGCNWHGFVKDGDAA